MNICFLSHEYPLWSTGGIGTFIQTIGYGMVAKGHQVTVVGIGYKDEEEVFDDKGIVIYRLPQPYCRRKSGIIFCKARTMRKKIEELHLEHPFDIIDVPEAGLYYWFGRQPFAKVIRMHGGHHFFAESENRRIKWGRGFIEKLSFRNADAFIAVSEYVKQHTSKYLSTRGRPIEIIRNPINGKLFRQADLSKTIKHRLVFAGTVCEKKGIRQLIEALKIVIPEFPDVHLDVYGRDWFFPDKRSYISFLKDTFADDVLKHVTFHGPISLKEIPSKYEKAELCVFPSHMETLGLVAPEAMFMGKPVLFSNTGPGPETIDHKNNGLLCNPYDPSDIAEKIIFAFKHPKEMEKIAKAGQEFAHKVFDLDNVIDMNISFYNSIRKKRKKRV